MRKLILPVVAVVLALAFSSCAKKAMASKYTYHFYDSFDTITNLVAYAYSDGDFEEFSSYVENRMAELHKLFDIYNNYEGINNAKTINDNAGKAPVAVAPELLNLLILSKEWYYKSGGTVNAAMGPVLSIWHDYREMYSGSEEDSQIPSLDKLLEASELCDIEDVIIDTENSTVFLAKEGMKLDVGAMAKGYATQLIVDELAGSPVQSLLISAGGNIVAKGKPLDGKRVKWGIGIQDPFVNIFAETEDLLDTLFLTDCSVVTSGDYQRFYVVDGKMMGHIIAPDTLMPADNFRSVTVIVEDSGIADALSTALFILPYEDGLDLITREGGDAVWVYADGTVKTTDGARAAMKSLGGATSMK